MSGRQAQLEGSSQKKKMGEVISFRGIYCKKRLEMIVLGTPEPSGKRRLSVSILQQ